MGQPRPIRCVSDHPDAGHRATAIGIGHCEGSVHLNAKLGEARPIRVRSNADRRDSRVKGMLGCLSILLDISHETTLGAIKLFHHRARQDLHALLLKGLTREACDFQVFDWQDLVLHLNHCNISAQRVVKACKLDADRTRPNHQKLLRHVLGCQGVLIGPDARAIGFQARQLPGMCAHRHNNVRRA